MSSCIIIIAKEKKIKQQKIMYTMLKNSKIIVGLFFLFIDPILCSITNKFSSYCTYNITDRGRT